MENSGHPDWGFTYLDNFSGKIKCDHCGEVLPGGIFAQMEHIGKCDGHKDKRTIADGPTTEFMKNITEVLDAPGWAEVAQIIVVNFLRMPDENKRAVLDKIVPSKEVINSPIQDEFGPAGSLRTDKTINHFLEFLRDDFGIELPDRAVQEYLKWKKDTDANRL